jgi:hypothetical protein
MESRLVQLRAFASSWQKTNFSQEIGINLRESA